MAPFPYFMHANVELVDRVFPLLQDICAEDDSKCYQNEYMLFCFENQDNFAKHDEEDDEKDEEKKKKKFTDWWSKEVSKEFGIDLEVVRGIYEDDAEEYEDRVDDIFWYGDGLGFDHLPALLINGELVDFPTTEEEWLNTISQGFPTDD